MTLLVNTAGKRSSRLLDVLTGEAKATSSSGTRVLYALSCYFDREALIALTTALARAVRSAGSTLVGCRIAVDVGDWTRQRCDRKALVRDVAAAAKFSVKDVELHAIHVSGCLVHAKGYALISPPRTKSRQRRGFVAVTSGNLTQRGLGLARSSNVELAHISRDSEALEAFRSHFHWLTKAPPLREAPA